MIRHRVSHSQKWIYGQRDRNLSAMAKQVLLGLFLKLPAKWEGTRGEAREQLAKLGDTYGKYAWANAWKELKMHGYALMVHPPPDPETGFIRGVVWHVWDAPRWLDKSQETTGLPSYNVPLMECVAADCHCMGHILTMVCPKCGAPMRRVTTKKVVG